LDFRFTAFYEVRESGILGSLQHQATRCENQEPPQPPADIQAILDVLGRRKKPGDAGT
jgi:hypothetical protein